jgi:PPIC-type PPIASE domain
MEFALLKRAGGAVLLGVIACQSPSLPPEGEPARDLAGMAKVSPGGQQREPLEGAVYPPGRWRLVDWSELGRTRLWVSHILIRHRGVPPHLVSLSSLGWTSAPDAPERTREDAFELAQRVAEWVRRDTTKFAEAAEQFSEDIATNRDGGSLGGVDASQWLSWPELLDAVSALGFGDVSRPVETAYGFHVILRRPVPPEGGYSGSRIIIGHDDAPWLRALLARGSIPHRSRASALALAQGVYEQALKEPSSFERLVQAHSEHLDAVRSGDFGEWSTTEQTPFPRSVDKLSQLEVGEIAPPIETAFGFEVIQRTANRPRATYAVQRVRVDGLEASSEAEVAQRARDIAAELQEHPERFEEYQRKYCCTGTQVWQEGQGFALTEAALARLEIGETTRIASRYEGGRFAILKRVDPGSWSPQRVGFELPNPTRPSLKRFIDHAQDFEVAAMGETAVRDLGLTGELAERLSSAHAVRGEFASAGSEEERWLLFQGVQEKIEVLLGATLFNQYSASVERHVEHELLEGPRVRMGRMAAPTMTF